MRINISLDDVCPHPNMRIKSLKLLMSLVEDFPNLKITLFVPTALCRFRNREKAFPLYDYKPFVDQLCALCPRNFEIGYHGHNHGHKASRSNNDEFRYVSQQQAMNILCRSKNIFKELGLVVQPIFRPPGFWINSAAVRACESFGIKTLALSKKKKYIRHIPKNILDITYVGPQPNDPATIVFLYHAGRDQKDYFNKKSFHKLRSFLTKNNPEFIFMGEVNGKN